MKYNTNYYSTSETNPNNTANNAKIQSSLRTTYNRPSQSINPPQTTQQASCMNQYYKGNATTYQTQTDYAKYNYAQYIPTKVSKYSFPSSYRVFDTSLQDNTQQSLPKKANISTHQHDNWEAMIDRTSAEDSICNKQGRISKSKNFQSNVFTEPGLNAQTEKRCAKETNYSKYSTTSQIYALSGCVKRNPKEINDDSKRPNITNVGRMMKLSKEYNADFFQSDTPVPIEMNFPTYQRYGSSYRIRPKSQITFSKEEDKAAEDQSRESITMRKCKGSYRHLKSSIFNNDNLVPNTNTHNNHHGSSAIELKAKEGNYFDPKGKRHYHTKETFRSHIVIE